MADQKIVQAVLNKIRKDKFTMVFTLPPVLKTIIHSETHGNKWVDIDSMEFSIYNCPVPPISVPPIEVPYGAQGHHISSYARKPYAPIKVGFAIDNEYKNYWVIWRWLQVLNDPLESLFVGPEVSGEPEPKRKYNYVTDFHVYGRDEYNNPKVRFDYYDCFPTGMAEINFNHRDPEEADCSFEFVFNQFTVTLLDTDELVEHVPQNEQLGHIPPEASRRTSIFLKTQ